MAFEGRWITREPRIKVAKAQATVAPRRLLFLERPRQDADAIVDLSQTGMKLIAAGLPPATDQVLDFDLRHPELRGAVTVAGRIQWIREVEVTSWEAGVRFLQVRDTTRVALQRLILLELGSTVLKEHRRLGFISPQPAVDGSFLYTIYDPERRELASVEVDADRGLYVATRRVAALQDRSREFPSLNGALGWVFATDGSDLQVDPPLSR
jgi:PilZ domain